MTRRLRHALTLTADAVALVAFVGLGVACLAAYRMERDLGRMDLP